MREVKKTIETIISRINVMRMIDGKKFSKKLCFDHKEIQFPFEITIDEIEFFNLKKREKLEVELSHMYI